MTTTFEMSSNHRFEDISTINPMFGPFCLSYLEGPSCTSSICQLCCDWTNDSLGPRTVQSPLICLWNIMSCGGWASEILQLKTVVYPIIYRVSSFNHPRWCKISSIHSMLKHVNILFKVRIGMSNRLPLDSFPTLLGSFYVAIIEKDPSPIDRGASKPGGGIRSSEPWRSHLLGKFHHDLTVLPHWKS